MGAAGIIFALGTQTAAHANTEWEGVVQQVNIGDCYTTLYVKDYDSTQQYWGRGEFLAGGSINSSYTCKFWLERRSTSNMIWSDVSAMHILTSPWARSQTYDYWDGPGYRIRACAIKAHDGFVTNVGCTAEY